MFFISINVCKINLINYSNEDRGREKECFIYILKYMYVYVYIYLYIWNDTYGLIY
jgi:hypothetical protein